METSLKKSRFTECQIAVILPRFHVHQIAVNFLMNGECDEQECIDPPSRHPPVYRLNVRISKTRAFRGVFNRIDPLQSFVGVINGPILLGDLDQSAASVVTYSGGDQRFPTGAVYRLWVQGFVSAHTVGTVPPSMTCSVPVIDAARGDTRNVVKRA
jgi:hypothetical protein